MKKVLIITYYWPPAGGPGVQRVLKFAKYLPEFGWQPVILTVKKGNFPTTDNSLLNEIHKECKVYKTKIFEPFELYKLFTRKSNKDNIPTYVLNKSENESLVEKLSKWFRANIFIPDAKIGWSCYIVKEGLKIVEKERPDLIFSSSPPHSLQIGALKLAQKSGIKWIADFRDPWMSAFWQADINYNKLSRLRNLKLEKSVLSTAHRIIGVSKGIINRFNDIVENEYRLIPNGFDESDYTYQYRKKNNKFTIVYTGTLAKSQKIENLLKSLQKTESSTQKLIELSFYGSFHPSIKKSILKMNRSLKVNVSKEISHDEVIKKMLSSDMLLLVIPDIIDNYGIITGKIFEYIATGNFILGIGPEKGEAAKILSETRSGKMFDYNADLTQVIEERFAKWKRGAKEDIDMEARKKYSRKSLTGQLAKVFNELL